MREGLRQEIAKAEMSINAQSDYQPCNMKRFDANCALRGKARWQSRCSVLLPLLCFLLFAPFQHGQCEVVLPNFGIVGQDGEKVAKLFGKPPGEHVLPKQIAVDFNEQGVIYGFVCEYWSSQDVLVQIKDKIEKITNGKQRSPSKDYFVWRDEGRKLAISLFVDKESNTIKLIAVSTDAKIRGKPDTKATEKAK